MAFSMPTPNPQPDTADQTLAALEQAIAAVVVNQPEGLSEHALMKVLAGRGWTLFESPRLRDPLALFRAHFLLFHCLYRLDDRLAARGLRLQISPLRIRCRPGTTATGPLPVPADPLRAYYLDLDQLAGTDRAAVERLLGDFWRRYLAPERRRQALAVLGLDAGADAGTIRARYRQLVMRHHPDRGGDKDTLQRINRAYACLRRTARP